MELNIPIKKGTKSLAILRLLNPFLSNLTDIEMAIVSTCIDMGIESITRYNRSNLRDKLKMGKYSFNNYILSLKKKGVIIQTTTDLLVNPKVKELLEQDSYTIKFNEQ